MIISLPNGIFSRGLISEDMLHSLPLLKSNIGYKNIRTPLSLEQTTTYLPIEGLGEVTDMVVEKKL